MIAVEPQLVPDVALCRLDVYDNPHTRAVWYAYLDWVRRNYQPDLKKHTIGLLVDMHLTEMSLTRTATRSSIYLHGSPEDLMAWMLTYA
jgi:hypothetical protein